jgi:hypothetical protein
MSDIVERLRDDRYFGFDMRCEAAAEIERLNEAELLRATEMVKLEQEIGRLRAQSTEAAAFLDGLAFRTEQHMLNKAQTAAECRAMAAKLRGE